LPLGERAVAGGTVGEVDGVLLAKDGLRVELDGLVVRLVAVGLVAGALQPILIVVGLLLGEVANGVLVDAGVFVLVRDGGGLGGLLCLRLGLRLGWGFLLRLGSFPLGLLPLSPLLLRETGSFGLCLVSRQKTKNVSGA